MRSPFETVFALSLLAFLSGCGAGPMAPADRKDTSRDGADTLEIPGAGHPEGIVVRSIPLEARPFGAGVSVEGVFYVTQLDAASMGQGALPVDELAASVAVGSVPTNVVFNTTGTQAYVTNQWSQNVGLVNVTSNTQTGTITLDGDPFNVIPSRDGALLYVTNNNDNVAVLDIAAGRVITTIPMPWDPNGLVMNAAGTKLYVSVPSGQVVEVHTGDNSVLRTFEIGGRPQDMALSSDGATLYLANEAGSLDIIDIATGTVQTRIALAGGAFGLAMSPDKKQIYVAQPAGYLTILDVDGTILKTLELGGMPRKVAFNAAGDRAIVANEAGWVDVIR